MDGQAAELEDTRKQHGELDKLTIPISLYSIPEITSLPPPKIQKDDNKASADYLKVK
jgi:hypothetical protein